MVKKIKFKKIKLLSIVPIAKNKIKMEFSEPWFFKGELIFGTKEGTCLKIVESVNEKGSYVCSLISLGDNINVGDEFYSQVVSVEDFNELFKDFI